MIELKKEKEDIQLQQHILMLENPEDKKALETSKTGIDKSTGVF